jgi:hypothetical protein
VEQLTQLLWVLVVTVDLTHQTESVVTIQCLVASHLQAEAVAVQHGRRLLALATPAALAVVVIAVLVHRLLQQDKVMLAVLETVIAVEAVAAQVRLV